MDNVLERFIRLNQQAHFVREEEILRVATDQSRVNKDLHGYTIDERVGGDVNESNRLLKRAQQRVEAARIIFTTCAGVYLTHVNYICLAESVKALAWEYSERLILTLP